MKNPVHSLRRTLPLLALCAGGLSLITPPVLADHGGARSANRNVKVKNEQEVKIKNEQNINVKRDVDVDVHHHGHGDDDDNFWGGFAAGAATAAVAGAVVRSLPRNNQPVVVNNVNYHVADGVYYQQGPSGYVVVDPPPGVTVTVLPQGAVQTTVHGQVYFKAGNVYYRPAMQNGTTIYTVVKL
jgi:hypothetical protein